MYPSIPKVFLCSIIIASATPPNPRQSLICFLLRLVSLCFLDVLKIQKQLNMYSFFMGSITQQLFWDFSLLPCISVVHSFLQLDSIYLHRYTTSCKINTVERHLSYFKSLFKYNLYMDRCFHFFWLNNKVKWLGLMGNFLETAKLMKKGSHHFILIPTSNV